MTKKLIRIKSIDPDKQGESAYTSSTMNFAFVSPPEERKQCTRATSCREYLARAALASLYGNTVNHWSPNIGTPVDFNRLRLLMVQDSPSIDAHKRRLFSGKAALNIIEAECGWDISRITTVVHPDYKNAWLLTGPKEWMEQPQLLSLMAWIMRLAAYAGPIVADNYDELETWIKDEHDRASESGSTDRLVYTNLMWDKMYVLTKFKDEVFAGMGQKEAWPDCNLSNFSVYSGFYTFASNSKISYSNHAEGAQKRFHELCKKYLPRKKGK
jgi:hypothetical protein